MVSIIVPVYNKEKYILKCLKSLINQTYKDIEIVVIDDGSKDKSLEICNKISKEDSRVHVYSKNNGGASSARNMGIENASGEKILFVDGDDYVKENYVEELSKYNEDLIICSYIMKEEEKEKYSISDNIVCTTKDMTISKCLDKKYCNLLVTPYLKLFKKDIITKNNIIFDESMTFGEDACFVFEYIKNIESMRIIPYFGYYNVIIPGTLSRKYLDDIYEQSLKLYKNIKKLKNKKNEKNIYFWAFRNIKLILFNERKSNYKKFKETLIAMSKYEDFNNIELGSDYLSLTDNIILFLLRTKMYMVLYIIYSKFR